jgi:branched-chain amino acid transport system permease protein
MNFATGQLVAVGAYLYYWLSSGMGVPFLPALMATLVLVGLLGVALHFSIMRHMSGQKGFAPIILTMGISIMLQHTISLLFGGGAQAVSLPVPVATVSLGPGVGITSSDILTIVLSLLMVGTVAVMIRYSQWGIQMRAAAENPLLAAQSGINIDRVFAVGWFITLVTLALMGISYSYATILVPDVAGVGLRGMAPAIVGGLDSVAGVLPGAILIALVENLSVLVLGESARDAAVMSVLLLVLVVRPTGLFGGRTVSRI